MMGEWQWLINLCAGSVLALIAWFAKTTRADNKEIRDDLTRFRLEVAKEYVTHTDLADIKQSLFRIETKLDAKADK